MRYLSERDPLARRVVQLVAEKQLEYDAMLGEAQAVRIANAVGRMLGG